MAKKFSELRETMRSEARAESDNRAAKLLAASIMAIAGMLLVFEDDEDGSGHSN